jgi:anti-sigma factor RsiW
MNPTDESIEGPAGFEAGRTLWRRCRAVDMPEDAAARFLDLAAFADGMLDDEERDRVAAGLAADPAARDDIAAARTLSGSHGALPGGLEQVIARASAIVAETAPGPGRVLVFRAPLRRRILQGLAQWGSLAAAIIVASWLGFAMGSGASVTLSQPGQTSQIEDANFLPELLDPATGFLRDLGGGQQT